MKNSIKKFKTKWTEELLNNPNIGIAITDKNRNHLFVNQFLCDTTGYKLDELLAKSAAIFHVSDKSFKIFGQKVLALLSVGKNIDLDYPFKHKNGKYFWVNISGSTVDSSGEMLWTMVDITTRVENEDAIKHLHERLELAVDGNRDIIWDWDLENGDFSVTQRWEDIIGYDKKVIPYTIKQWRKYIHPEDLRDVLKNTTACMKGESKYLDATYRLKHNDGHWIWINMRGVVQFSKNSNSKRMIGTKRDVTLEKYLQIKIEQQQVKLEYQANHDALTGLPNRLLFHDRLDQALKKAKRYKLKMALFFIDLDFFKEINDTMGHKVGDEVLKIVSQRIKDAVREEDTVARLGGDEFTIIVEEFKNKNDISSLAKKVLKSLNKPMNYDGESLHISSSIGISIYPANSTDSDTLLSCADTAMYDAKIKGKNNFQFYSVK